MPKAATILIHEFSTNDPKVSYDEDGDPMVGFYFQFADEADQPVTGLIGPYRYNVAAERAAIRAFHSKDF